MAAAYEKGADTVDNGIDCGPLPAFWGSTGELMAGLLEDAGFRYRWIMLDTPSDIGVTELLTRIQMIFRDKERVGLISYHEGCCSRFSDP